MSAAAHLIRTEEAVARLGNAPALFERLREHGWISPAFVERKLVLWCPVAVARCAARLMSGEKPGQLARRSGPGFRKGKAVTV
jgi:hypothetical protein